MTDKDAPRCTGWAVGPAGALQGEARAGPAAGQGRESACPQTREGRRRRSDHRLVHCEPAARAAARGCIIRGRSAGRWERFSLSYAKWDIPADILAGVVLAKPPALVSGRLVLARTLTDGVWAKPEAAGSWGEGGLERPPCGALSGERGSA